MSASDCDATGAGSTNMPATSRSGRGRTARAKSSCAPRAEDHEDAPETPPGSAAPAVIAETRTDIAHLSVGEAVMRMELADHPVMMFRDLKSGVLNVVYRRADGHIGWIDPGD